MLTQLPTRIVLINKRMPLGRWPWSDLTIDLLDQLAHRFLIGYITSRTQDSPAIASDPSLILTDALQLMGRSYQAGYSNIRLLIALLDGELALKEQHKGGWRWVNRRLAQGSEA